MDKRIQAAWAAHNDALRSRLKDEFSDSTEYVDLLRITLSTLFGDGDEYGDPDPAKITVVDHGDYQGTLVFVIGGDCYQPGPRDHWTTHNYYGSCSGCDTLLDLKGDCENYDDDTVRFDVSQETVDVLWILCLHMMQRMKRISEDY